MSSYELWSAIGGGLCGAGIVWLIGVGIFGLIDNTDGDLYWCLMGIPAILFGLLAFWIA